MTRGRAGSDGANLVRWNVGAELDLVDIATYIARDSPSAARAVVTRLRAHADELRDFPQPGRIVPELQRVGISEWRELIVNHYRLIYTAESGTVEIDLVADARRDFEALLYARLLRASP